MNLIPFNLDFYIINEAVSCDNLVYFFIFFKTGHIAVTFYMLYYITHDKH